jgi:hypothetical protein
MEAQGNIMRKLEISFPHHRALCVFPDCHEQLNEAMAELSLNGSYPVIVLIGGYIQNQHAEATQKAIETIAAFAEENQALVICGGTEVGIMGSIGQTRIAQRYRFPLLGITLEKLVTWPGGPHASRSLWWRKEHWSLSTGYSHFILAPGQKFGEDSPWLAEAASHLSRVDKSVTILANGGGVARKDVALSLEYKRPVIVLAGTGRLADSMADEPDQPALVMTVQARDEVALREVLQSRLGIAKEARNEAETHDSGFGQIAAQDHTVGV